jgi:hypothetical protein
MLVLAGLGLAALDAASAPAAPAARSAAQAVATGQSKAPAQRTTLAKAPAHRRPSATAPAHRRPSATAPAHRTPSAMARHTAHALRATSPDALSEPHAPLSYSDEYERAELVERMLAECRGIPYNAYELAQTSGEALWLPAPIQLVTVRVHHPYCPELLRTYARKSDV